jgi:LemA protein
MKRRSSVATVLLVVLIVIVALALVGGGCAISGYNKAIRYEETVSEKWAQVENVLQRRFDLIPNVVETVKGYAAHEKGIFTDIAEARTKYFNAGSASEKAAAATGFERALSRLLMLKETYPQLKADQSFLALQAQLEGTENRISVERKRYNEAVKALNTYHRSFFGRMFCGWAGVESAEYFEAPEEAQAVPKVDFSPGQ